MVLGYDALGARVLGMEVMGGRQVMWLGINSLVWWFSFWFFLF